MSTKETTTKDQKKPTQDKFSAYQTEVIVPSKGKFYDGKLPDGKVTLRPISVQEEKLFLSASVKTQVADKVLARCMVDCPLAIRDFLMTDKYFLLLHLRSISYGHEYAFKLQCPSCKFKFVHKLQLPEGLTLKLATDEDVEPFEVELPVAKVKLGLRFLRGYDEEEIEAYVKQNVTTSAQEGDPSYEFQLSRCIVTIDGKEVNALEKLNFCKNMIGRDSFEMRKAIASHETGIDLGIQVSCPSCMTEIETLVPFTNEFFPSGVSRG